MSTDVGTTQRRRLSTREKLKVWEREKGCCHACGAQIRASAGERYVFEHMRPLALGGTNDLENIRLSCHRCEPEKTKKDNRRSAKAKRSKQRHLGMKTAKRPMPGSRNTPWKRTIDGRTVRRHP